MSIGRTSLLHTVSIQHIAFLLPPSPLFSSMRQFFYSFLFLFFYIFFFVVWTKCALSCTSFFRWWCVWVVVMHHHLSESSRTMASNEAFFSWVCLLSCNSAFTHPTLTTSSSALLLFNFLCSLFQAVRNSLFLSWLLKIVLTPYRTPCPAATFSSSSSALLSFRVPRLCRSSWTTTITITIATTLNDHDPATVIISFFYFCGDPGVFILI